MKNHILIIDDDEMIRNVVAQYLVNEGYKVSAAGTGEAGLSILGQEEIDLVLLDLNLPDGDGLGIEQQIREEFSIPIIIVTARTGQDDKLMALSLGASAYLTKPVDEKELLLRVRNFLSLAGNGTEATPAPAAPENNAQDIEEALSHGVEGFLDHARTGAVGSRGRGSYGAFFKVMAIIIVIAAGGGGGAYWYFGPKPAPPVAKALDEKPPVDTATERPLAKEPAQQTPEKKTAIAPVDLPVEQPAKPAVDRSGYEWVLKSKCDPIPDVEWWKTKTHESIAAYVHQKHDGNWKAYMNQWFRRLVNLQQIDGRNSGAVTSTGVVLKGKELKAYIKKTRERLSVIRCLAQEAKIFSSGK